MITLSKANLVVGEGRTASLNIDDIIGLQTVPSEVIGKSTTMVFVRQCQPLSVVEREDEIAKKIIHARAVRRVANPNPDGTVSL